MPSQRSALAELQAARPVIQRLGSEQNSEDRAADLIEGWGAVETALRSLIGGSALTGRALIHELRSRHIITFDQANVLAEFEAARSRAERTAYEPTDADVRAAQEAFRRLEWSLSTATVAEAAQPLVATPARGGDTATPAPEPSSVPSMASMVPTPAAPDWLRWAIGAVVLLAVVGLGTWLYMRSTRESTLERAVALYRQGQREQAAAAFERAARENPRSALPHVYLSRMARDIGNLTLARDEANRAIQAEPQNALALREMGAYLLTTGNYELARRFYVRAVQADTSDKTAQGYLGCTLIRLGRRDEGQRWLTRAGPGNWSSCATMAPGPGMPGMPAPGMPAGAPPPIQPNP